MNTSMIRRLRHLGIALCAAIVCLGCFASTYRSARVMKGGQASIGAGYLKPIAVDDESDESHYGSLDLRLGTGAGVDLGLMYSNEFSDGGVPTIWGDFRAQVTNRDNTVGKPILTLGFGKGYIMEDVESHITRIPVQFGVPVSEGVITTLTYQGDWISDDILPLDSESSLSLRSTFTLGAEVDFVQRDPTSWIPKLGFGIGYMTGEDWEDRVMFNVGVSFDSPFTP